MPEKRNTSDDLTTALKAALDERLSDLKQRISERAYDLANPPRAVAAPGAEAEPARLTPTIHDLSQAIDELVSGQQSAPDRPARFFDLFPPFTCICAALCIAFASLGLIAMVNTTAAKIGSGTASGFLDIAKIFAGAIVGSTASIALGVASARKKKN